MGLNINKYLSFNYFNLDNFNKDNLRKFLEKELIKYNLDINIVKNYAVNYYKRRVEKLKDENKDILDIYK